MDTQSPGRAVPAAATTPVRGRKSLSLDQQLRRFLRLLYQNEASGLRGYLERMRVDPADAEELVNDTFTVVFRAMQRRGGPHREPRAFLYRVASNKARWYPQEKRRRDRRLDRVLQVEQADARLPQPDETSRIDDRHELAREPALNSLPDRQREAFILRHYHGFLPEEIATVMGIKVDTVDTHLQRASQKLTQLRGQEAS